MNLKDTIRSIPDFPKPGIIFRDITTLLKDPLAYRQAIDEIAAGLDGKNIDIVVGPEARGYIVGAPLAYALGAGFVLARKPGKLPAETISHSYGLEYGQDMLQMHVDAIKPGQRVLLADDLLATGGTALAVCRLVEQLGGEVVAARFLIELTALGGREKLTQYDTHSLMSYDS